jgi:Putative Flp pilus-assembly TadE/G-like
MRMRIQSARKNEQGQTIILVAIALIALLAMAALAIDVVTLYVARSEAQRIANAAAVAGAKMFATSGFTSAPASAVTQTNVCQSGGSGSPAAANVQVFAIVQQNTVAGQLATIQNITCSFPSSGNPQISVTINRTGLPTFFARIWGRTSNSVTASATAEAYNPSGLVAPVNVSIKPWLIPNCDPTAVGAACPGNPFIDPTTGAIPAAAQYIGKSITLDKARLNQAPQINAVVTTGTVNTQFYALDVPSSPTTQLCPSTSRPSCGGLTAGGPPGDYMDNIACSNPLRLQCGLPLSTEGVTIYNANGLSPDTQDGTLCLIHANNPAPWPPNNVDPTGNIAGQDLIKQPGTGNPTSIVGGTNNPNTPIVGQNISRSDSFVTVPIYDVPNAAALNLCPGGACKDPNVIGFLQLAIQQETNPPGGGGGNAGFTAVIVNAAGCNATPSGNPVSGGGVSPVPVRLIGQ